MSTKSTRLFIQHAIGVKSATHGTFQIDNLSSLKFSKLDMIAEVTGSCRLYMLQFTKNLTNMLTD